MKRVGSKGRPEEELTCCTREDLLGEEEYLEQLKESLSRVVTQLEATGCEVREKYVRKEEAEGIICAKEQTIEAAIHENCLLKNENYNLKIKVEQYERRCKRYETKLSLLNNKLFHLSKMLSEK